MPGNIYKKIVVSFSSRDTPRFVGHKNGSFDCTCPGFKNQGLCSHIIAVAFHTKQLQKFLQSMANLHKVAAPLLPKKGGRKPNENHCKRKAPVDRNVREMIDEHPVSMPIEANENGLQLIWVKDERVTTCYGCGGQIRKKPSDPPPITPFDIMLKGKDRRSYRHPKTGQLRITVNRETVFYHISSQCIKNKRSEFERSHIVIDEVLKQNLGPLHKRTIKNELGIVV